MAKIYWRTIKRGTRTLADVPNEELRNEIKELAKQDVEKGVITTEQYADFIGEAYA